LNTQAALGAAFAACALRSKLLRSPVFGFRRLGRDITVHAESSAEARRTVMDMFPGAVVTGVHRVK
jgi:hypothetical protein